MARHALLFLLAFIASAGALFAAATCSADAYKAACASCPFDSSGKMNETCYNGQISKGTSCIMSSYPVLATSYSAGKCPDVKACQTGLEFCKDSLHGASDREDCNVAAIRECYSDADACLEKANQKCDVKPQDIAAACPFIYAMAFIALIVLLRR